MNKCVGVKIISWKDVPETVRILYKIPESGYVEKQFSESPDGALHIEYKWIGESIADSLIKRLTKTQKDEETKEVEDLNTLNSTIVELREKTIFKQPFKVMTLQKGYYLNEIEERIKDSTLFENLKINLKNIDDETLEQKVKDIENEMSVMVSNKLLQITFLNSILTKRKHDRCPHPTDKLGNDNVGYSPSCLMCNLCGKFFDSEEEAKILKERYPK